MPPPRICILSSVHFTFDVRMFQAEARTLARAGFDVVVIALEDATHSNTDGIRVISLPRPANRLRRMLQTIEIFRLARAQDAALIAIHDPELLPVAILLKLFSRVGIVFDVHEDVPASIRNRSWLPRPLRPLIAFLYSVFERASLPFLDGLTLADRAYAKYYPGRNARPILNYPLPMYADLYDAERTEAKRPTLVYVGSITHLRGLEQMLELTHRLRAANPEILLRLVGPFGSEAERSAADSMIREFEIGGNVEFTGPVSHLEVHRCIHHADVGLALLHPDPNYLKSLPTKMFEYMMMGRPVVVSHFRMWREIVDECGCGYALDPFDVDGAARAVQTLLSNAALRTEMGRNGRKAVMERYNWDAEGVKLVKFYRNLLE